MGIDGVVSLLRKAGLLRAGGATYHGRNVGGDFATLDQLGGGAPPPTIVQPSGVPPVPPPTVASPSAVSPTSPVTSSPAEALLGLLSWLVGLPVVVVGLAMTFTSVTAGLAWMLGGLILIPPTNRLLSRVLRVRITGWRKAVALLACVLAFFVAAASLPDDPVVSASQRYQLTLLLEDDLGMRDVLVGQAGSRVVIRFRQPTMPAEELFAALTAVSDIVEPRLPEGIETIRYVFTVRAVDAGYVDVSREALQGWRDGDLTNADFVRSLKRVPLI